MLTPCEQITEKIGELFICSPLNEYVRIRTPFFIQMAILLTFSLRKRENSLH